MPSFTGAPEKLGKLLTVVLCSFAVLSVLVLRVLLGVNRIKGVTGSTTFMGINGYLMASKLAGPTASGTTFELLLLSLLVATTQRIFLSEKCERKSEFH